MSWIFPPTDVFLGFWVVLIAATTAGLTGFGFALVTVPLLLILFPPKVVVPIALILYSLGSTLILYDTWRWINLKRIWSLVVAGAVGTPLGAYLLLILDVNSLKVLIGVVISVSALALLTGVRWQIRRERLARTFAGFASGLLAGSTAMAGPPVILLFSNQDTEKQSFRANLTVFFALLNLVSIFSQWRGGLITARVLSYTVWFLPASLIGMALGIRLAHRVSEAIFRKVTLMVVTVSGLAAIASGIGLF